MSDRSEESLTAYVADFITRARAANVPAEVTHLGKRSILDGIGLALAGSVAESGHIVRRYLRSLGCAAAKGSTVIGSALELPARFAAFANGVAIHADDYDDTQLAVAKDRVYGLLTHPTAPALPPVLRSASRSRPRSPRRSTRATIRTAFTRPRPSARSAPPRAPLTCSASIANARGARWGWPRASPRGCARISAP